MTATLIQSRREAVEQGTLQFDHARKQEFRSNLQQTRTVTKGDKEFIVLDGVASSVNSPYVMYDFYGEYEEQIAATAFDVTLAKNPDVNFLINHTGLAMARTVGGTLELSVDEVGLRSVAYLNPNRGDVQDLKHAIDDGNVDQMSFAFRIVNGRWNEDYTMYTITEVDLDRGDVSAVNYGANPNTSISARAKQALEAIEHLEGEPLRAAAARANARLAEAAPASPVTVVEPVVRGGRSVATIRALEALDED